MVVSVRDRYCSEALGNKGKLVGQNPSQTQGNLGYPGPASGLPAKA